MRVDTDNLTYSERMCVRTVATETCRSAAIRGTFLGVVNWCKMRLSAGLMCGLARLGVGSIGGRLLAS